MKHIKLLFLLLLISGLGYGQYTVDFEGAGETKGSYASGNVTLNGIDWNLTEALIGTSANDWKNGIRSARLRGYGSSAITMIADKTNGIGTISFNYRGFGTDTQVDWRVEYSIDSGTTWIQAGSDFTASSVTQTFSAVINNASNARIQIVRATTSGSSNRRLNVDDISITDFVCTDTLDDVFLQFPITSPQTITQGNNFTVYARGYEPGVTPGSSGPSPNIEAWIGYSTNNSNPIGVDWTWIPATFNVDVGNDDEYQAEIGSALTPGTYYYATRWRLNGCYFTYGGNSGGVWNNNSVQLIVEPDVADFYNLQSPATGSINVGGVYNVYARVYEPGVTPAAGSDSSIEAWIGYSTSNTNPDTWTDWVPATFNTQFGNDDEYVADIGTSIPNAGKYYYASRFRLNGSSFTYGGITPPNNGDEWDGITYISGVLSVIAPDCSELMISEYHEGTGSEKYLELYNSSSASIDLSNYDLIRYGNGATTPSQTLNLSGTLVPYSTQVYKVSGASLYTGSSTSTNVVNFNGDDVIALSYTGGAIIDIIGDIGTTTNFAQNVSLKRNANVLTPNSTYTTTEWTISSMIDDISDIGSHISDCQTICSGTTVTWNGSWSNAGVGPSASDNVVLATNYNTNVDGNITACSLTINSTSTLTIGANSFIQITNDINNNGSLVVAEAGSLVQVTDTASFINSSSATTPVTVSRQTAPVSAWYEYTYWSSPVPDATLESLLPATPASRKFSFNAANFYDNQAEALDNSGTFTPNDQDDIDDNGDDWQYASGTMSPGVGYAATLGETDLFGPGATNGVTKLFQGTTVNSGTVTVPVNRNDSSLLDNNWNLVGNPYPSAIDVDLFLAENLIGSNPNAVLQGAIYLWSHETPPSATTLGNEPLNFDLNDYAVINLGANVAGEEFTPTKYIGSGQGFFVLVDNSATMAGASVTFKNSMRVTGNNDEFYRVNTTNLDNKLWLNLTSDNGVFSQLAVAYVNGATNGDDGATYDARRFYNGGSAMLVSFVENSTIPLAIQGKQPETLDLNEVIPLGFTTGITSPTIYTISIDHLQGDFLTNNSVYLKDNLLNTYQDLTTGDYSFTSDFGEFNNRFEVVFTQPTLSIDEQVLLSNNFSIIETSNDNVTFKLSNSDLTITSVQIFDALGRLLYNLKGSNSSETYTLSNLSQATYIAKVELSNGQIITKKAIKK